MSNVSTYAQAKQFAIEAGTSLVSYTIDGFFKVIHERFYQGVDISFMDYFLEIVDKEFEFVVPHSKLVEFGVVSAKQSQNVMTKLKSLDLEESEHYLLIDINEQRLGRGGSNTKVYMLTPEAFKLALIRARSYTGQTVNPLMYGMYYILLEKIFKLYILYGKSHDAKMSAVLLRDVSKDRDDALEARKKADEDRAKAEADRKRAAEVADESKAIQAELIRQNNEILAISRRLETDNTVLQVKNSTLIAKVDNLTSEVGDLKTDNHELKIEVGGLKTEVGTLSVSVEQVRKELADKKILSTMLPISRNLDHYVAVAMLETEHSWMVQIIAMQELSFDKKLSEFVHEDIQILSSKTFIANGIDFRNNVALYNTAAAKSICKLENVSLAKLKRDGLKLGKMKTVIPKDCPFTLELFMASFEDVLTDTQVKERFASLKKD